jgi:hypothetical protein
MHEQGAHPSCNTPTTGETTGLAAYLPATAAQKTLQVGEVSLGIGAGERFGHTQLAQLAGLAVVDPAE